MLIQKKLSSSYQCNAVPEWRPVSNFECCGHFGGGEISFHPIRPVERYSDSAKNFC